MPVLSRSSLWSAGSAPLSSATARAAQPASVTCLQIGSTHVGDAGASALAAALGRGALPRLKVLLLGGTAIGDAGLVALAPALRRLPALETLSLIGNPLGDEGLTALVAPPPLPAGALPPPAGGLKKLVMLYLDGTQVSDASCAILAAALDNGALPALGELGLQGTPASDAARASVMAWFADPDTDYGSNTDDSDEE